MSIRIDEFIQRFDSDREMERRALKSRVQSFFQSTFPLYLNGRADPEVGDILPVLGDGSELDRSDRGDRMLWCGWKQLTDIRLVDPKVSITCKVAHPRRGMGGPILFVPGDGPIAAVRIRRKNASRADRRSILPRVSYVGVGLSHNDVSYTTWLQRVVIDPFEEICASYDAMVEGCNLVEPPGHHEMETAKRVHGEFVDRLRGK